MIRNKKYLTSLLLGGSLSVILVATHAASNQSPADDFTKDKTEYIRLYAWPKRSPQSNELLFVTNKNATNKRDFSLKTTPVPAPTVNIHAPPPGPPPQENKNENDDFNK